MNEPRVITLENPDPETARIFAEADKRPVRVECDGIISRIEREDHWRYYHPEAQRRTPQDTEQIRQGREECGRIIREAKPEKKPIEYGAETRYGRESYGNAQYNEALDEYEEALLKRIGANPDTETPT